MDMHTLFIELIGEIQSRVMLLLKDNTARYGFGKYYVDGGYIYGKFKHIQRQTDCNI